MNVHLTMRDRIAIVTIDNAPVNALSAQVRSALLDTAKRLEADGGCDAVVLTGAGKVFVGGADISEFDKDPVPPHLPDVINAFEQSQKPWVAAMNGLALGGGFELCLGCHARVMSKDAQVAMPEVSLGIIPGAGGTQRLPRLATMDQAIDMVTEGKRVGASDALAMGLVDQVADGDVVDAAVAEAERLVREKVSLRRTSQLPVRMSADAEIFKTTRAKLTKRARGQRSQLLALDAFEAAATKPFAEASQLERKTFLDARTSVEARALRHVFFAERDVFKVDGVNPDLAKPVALVGVVGGGTMGRGIAASFADAGIPAIIVETSDEALTRAMSAVAEIYDGQAKRGRISADAATKRKALITGATDTAALKDCDLVVEAVFEDMAVKRDVFAKLDSVAKPTAILATNTSYLDPNEISKGVSRPAQMIGLHFFSPANVMKLVEVIRCNETDEATTATTLAVSKKLRKIPVIAGVCEGFIGNRILMAYRRQAETLVEDGAMPWDVDRALTGFGWAMGPFAVSDLAGLDISWRNRLKNAATRDPAVRYPSTVADRLCEMERFGRKTNGGFYDYADGNAKPSPLVEKLVLDVAKEKGIARKTFSDEDILTRVLATMINEAARILDEGIALRASDIDLVEVHGYGFPRHRGGVTFHADVMGLSNVLKQVEALHAALGKGYEPSALLRDLVAKGAPMATYIAPRRS